MKLSTFLLILPVLGLSSCAFSKKDERYVAAHYSYFDGKQYEFRLTAKEVYAAPSWNPQKKANPPLSAAEALKAAEKFIAQFPIENEAYWEFQELSLTKVIDDQHWAWKAEFRYVNGIVTAGGVITMQCWILMNGKVIQPRSRNYDHFRDFVTSGVERPVVGSKFIG